MLVRLAGAALGPPKQRVVRMAKQAARLPTAPASPVIASKCANLWNPAVEGEKCVHLRSRHTVCSMSAHNKQTECGHSPQPAPQLPNAEASHNRAINKLEHQDIAAYSLSNKQADPCTGHDCGVSPVTSATKNSKAQNITRSPTPHCRGLSVESQ